MVGWANGAAVDASGNVSIAGAVGTSNATLMPCYWRNGTLGFLPKDTGAPMYGYTNGVALDASGSLFIIGDAATSAAQTPCYWRNVALTVLPQATPTPLMVGKRVLVSPR